MATAKDHHYTTESTSTTATTMMDQEFQFPQTYHFPPFFTIQPTEITRQAQMKKWSTLIQDYCRFHKIFQLTVVDFLERPLFYNKSLKKRLAEKDIKIVIDFMVSLAGDERAEWVGSGSGSGSGGGGSTTKTAAWIWWKKPEEWGNSIANWVEDTGQKGSVLTLYEIVESEATENQEFHGMDVQVLQKSLTVLAKKGRAQVFGTEDQQGVKFF